MALADVVDLLACPVCAARESPDVPLTLTGRALGCPAGHAYDVARQGYVNLSGQPEPQHADTAPMVAARERFLGSGAYAPVVTGLLEAVCAAATPVGTLLEPGAGPGWYLAQVLRGLSDTGTAARGVALDVSLAAVRRAAAVPGPVGAVVADVWGRLPVRGAGVDVVLSVFAPRHAAEFARVLRPGGSLVVVTPLPEHLRGLREVLGLLAVEPGKQQRLDVVLGAHLDPVARSDVRFRTALGAAAATDLVAMGPNAFHTAPEALAAQVAAAPLPEEVEVAVQVGVWRRPG